MFTKGKGCAPLLPCAAAVGQSACSQRRPSGACPGGQEGKHRQGNAESPSQAASSTLLQQGGVDPATSSLPVPCEQLASADQPCRKHMLVTIKLQACSYRAAGGGTARHRATRHHSTHPSHPPPGPAPATVATQTRRWGKVGAFKPANLHSSPRDQEREFSHLGMSKQLSHHFFIFFLQKCGVFTEVQPHCLHTGDRRAKSEQGHAVG